MKNIRHKAVLAVALALALVAGVAPAAARSARGDLAVTQGFRRAVTVGGILEHLQAFQAASDTNGGNRVGGGPGFEASAEYVTSRLAAAGYTVTNQYFSFLFNADRTPPVLRQDSPDGTTYVDGVDFASMTFSESTEVSAPIHAVELNIPAVEGAPDNSNTSGCEAADFAGFPAGSIALVMRGTCTFAQKADNARAAGAVATIVMNEGNSVGRAGVIQGTLGSPGHGPALGTSYAAGVDLANGIASGATGVLATVRIDRVEETRVTRNVIAETSGGDPNHVVVVGAHLDSVSRGAGINDNGTGSATILEVAEVLAAQQREVRNKIRFVWWGAEEFGLLGSQAYVASLSQAERDRIELNLNFDMIGSPNYGRFVYDGDNSAFPAGAGVADGPAGSGDIEQVFRSYFDAVGLASAETPFNGRSDYGPFIAAGIPAGGLFTGAEGVKTASEAALFGGTAGQAYDPCYHLACDTLANVNERGLDEMSDAVAHVVLTFSRRSFDAAPLTDPAPVAPTGGSGGGGGLHPAHEEDAAA